MIPKFEDFIKEGFLSKTYDRYRTGELRHEDGKKVTTSFGTTLILKDRFCDYEKYIKEICNHVNLGGYDFEMDFCRQNEYDYSFLKIVDKDLDDYVFRITDKILVQFNDEDLMRVDDFKDDKLSKEDYKSIIRSIVDALRNRNVNPIRSGNNYYFNIMSFGRKDFDVIEDKLQRDFKKQYKEPHIDISYYDNGETIDILLYINYDTILKYFEILDFIQNYIENING